MASVFLTNYLFHVDHPLELQLSRDALVQAGFCRALDAIKAVVYFAVENRGGKRSTVDTRLGQLMSNYDTLSPKLAANNLDMLYLVDAKFNGEVRIPIRLDIPTVSGLTK